MSGTLRAPARGGRNWRLGVVLALLIGLAAGLLAPAGVAASATVTVTFTYTGAEQSWIVPAGVTSATFTVYGAQGGQGQLAGGTRGAGGRGGSASATLAVVPGQTIQIMVGGAGGTSAGGFNGGGTGGTSARSFDGGGGGGASDVRTGACAATTTCGLADRAIVAGGGGGGGSVSGDGGAGGGAAGVQGTTSGEGTPGGGGTASAGGAGGGKANGGSTAGDAGQAGTGGAGGFAGCGCGGPGGGGGGYFGGGGGGFEGGGGGGSGFGPGGTVFATGVRAGDGLITVSFEGIATAVVARGDATYGDTTATLTATLTTTPGGAPLPVGSAVTLTYNGQDYPATTDAAGVATATAPLPPGTGAGSYAGAVQASFAGVGLYAASQGSGALVVAKAPLTVTADNQSRPYGAANPPLTATLSGFVNGENLATSGVSGAAALGTTATASSPVAGGPYAITIGQGTLAAANYTFTPLVPGHLTVTKAGLTVTADNQSRPYGAANPPLTATITGFANGENATTAGVSGSPALGTTATTGSPVGPYPITIGRGTLAAANYDVASLVPGTLTVAKAPLTVTADDQARPYGAANPPLTYTITGFVNGENATTAGVSGSPALGAAATASSPVAGGPYAITVAPGTLAAANYDFANLVPGRLTVTRAPLTVTADDKVRPFGVANPPLTATLSGFANGENPATAGVTGAAALGTTATTGSPVGPYPITAAQGTLAAANYDFASFVPGTLTVGVAPTALVQVRGDATYGTPSAILTATLRRAGDNTPVAGATIRFLVGGVAVCGGGGLPACPTTDARGVATLAGVPIATGRAAGSYANLVQARFAGDAGYQPAEANGPLIVARRILVVKPVDQTVALNQPNPTGCALALAPGSAFLPGDSWASVNLTNLRCTTSRNYPSSNAAETVGKTYKISATGFSSANYDLRLLQGTLTVVAP